MAEANNEILNPLKALIEEALAVDPATKKPGYLTSEFWLHAVGFAVCVGLGFYGVAHDNNAIIAIAAGAGFGSNAAYSLGRSLVKRTPRIVG